MSSNLTPLKLYGDAGPNPIKVLMFLKELDLPHEIISIPFSDVKKPDYVAVNPNGRLPSLHDPNTGITLWESGAIIEYLIERYDKEHKLSFPQGSPESYLAKQWLFYQVSGQGPYYGNAIYFMKYHDEQLPSAITRFTKEINRVSAVLENWLAEQKKAHPGGDGPWLVGNKLSYADISFVMWQSLMGPFLADDVFDANKYPLVKEWLAKMESREAIKTAEASSKH